MIVSLFKRIQYYSAEIISAFYLNCFVVLKPILKAYSNISTIILDVNLIFLLILFLFFSGKEYDKRKVKSFLLITFVVLLSVCLDYFTRFNDAVFGYLQFFIIYGAVPAFFFLKVNDLKYFLSIWSFFAILGGAFIANDPFCGYAICEDYMTFGSNILPAYAASLIQFYFYKRKIFIIPMLFFLFEIIFFSHKGATFAALCLFLCFFISNSKQSIKNYILGLFGVVLFLNLYKQIIEQFIFLSKQMGVYSYSLSGFEKMFLFAANDEIVSVRTKIWMNVFYELNDSFALGLGVGGFQSRYGGYPHNFFLDILITYGVPLGVVVFFFIIIALHNVIRYRANKFAFIFLMTMFVLWFVPMMSSFTYWMVMPFWVFIYLSFYFNDDKFRFVEPIRNKI